MPVRASLKGWLKDGLMGRLAGGFLREPMGGTVGRLLGEPIARLICGILNEPMGELLGWPESLLIGPARQA